MFRQMLLTSAMRAVHAPENDEGGEFDEGPDEGFEDADEGEDGDEEQDELDAGDGEEGGDEEGDDPPPRQQSRGQTRFQKLDARAKAEKERADRLEGELAEARRVPAGPQKSPQEAERERTAYLATLTEAGRLEFLINESKQQTQAELNQIKFTSWDSSDKTAFQGLCSRNTALAALEGEVEQELTKLRASGQNASRETIAKYLLGEKALAKAGRAKTAGRKREQEGRDRQGARPVNGRGDAPPSGNRKTSDRAARAKRLEGAII